MSDPARRALRQDALLVAGLAAALGVGGYLWFWRPHLSATQIATAGDECKAFIAENFATDEIPRVSDYWKRGGRLVMEIALARPGETRARLRLCVVDFGTGTVLSPGAFDRRWDR